MRVVYFLLHFPCLTETFVAEEINELRQQNVDVRIVSLLAPDSETIQEESETLLSYCDYSPAFFSIDTIVAQITWLIRRPVLYLSLLWLAISQPYISNPLIQLAKRLVIFAKAAASARHLAQQDVDLLHSHFAWLSGLGVLVAARLLDKPFTVTAHAYDIFATNDLLNVVVSNATKVFTISEYNRRVIVQTTNCVSSQISIVHCGINPQKLESVLDVETKRASAPDDTLHILSVGSLNEKKGHKYLIEACAVLKQMGIPFLCNIIGRGNLFEAHGRLIDELGLSDHITLLGPKTRGDVLRAYAHHDVFVLASTISKNGDRDGIPVVMMEAGLFGMPIVSTAVSGIPELVIDGFTGLIVPPEDPAALADAILRLAKDPGLRRELGSNAQDIVRHDFNSVIIAQYLAREMANAIATAGQHGSGNTTASVFDATYQ